MRVYILFLLERVLVTIDRGVQGSVTGVRAGTINKNRFNAI